MIKFSNKTFSKIGKSSFFKMKSSMVLMKNINLQQQRNIQYTPQGTGGRSSVSGIVATVFGATGFLGRYIVNQLGKIGSQIVIPYRGAETSYRHLKVMGDLGQIIPIPYDPRNYESIERTVRHSNVVINLIGKDYGTRNFSLDDTNVKLARLIAKISKQNHVERYVHMSSIIADPYSPSDWARSKGRGEEGVKELFPEATILRPSEVFGAEDNLTNWQAWWIRNSNIVPVFKPNRVTQPIYGVDVGKAVLQALKDQSTIGKTYELVGPTQYNMQQFCNSISNLLLERPTTVNFHPLLASVYSTLGDYFIRRAYLHKSALQFRSLDALSTSSPEGRSVSPQNEIVVEPLTRMEDVGLIWLRRYRRPQHLNLAEDEEFEPYNDVGILKIASDRN